MSVEKGKPWGRPGAGAPDLTVEGDDAALADAVAAHPGARIVLAPRGSDLARAVGLPSGDFGGIELPCDALTVEAGGTRRTAVNMVVVGVPPDRQRWWSRSPRVSVRVDDRAVYDGKAVGVVVASGQFLRGRDVVPRGHPGDGRAEVQVYALGRRERHAMRVRLPLGDHVPHPRIRTAAGHRVEVHLAGGPRPVEIDGVTAGARADIAVTVVPGAFSLLV